MRWLALASLVSLVLLPLAASGSAEPAEATRQYVGGGSAMGTRYACMPELPFDLLAACDVPCPGNTCNIEVIDDVKGHSILFRICFDGETFCRPELYFGYADVPGFHARVTVVPQLDGATHGVVIVR